MLAATVLFNAVVVNSNCVQRCVIIIYYFITPQTYLIALIAHVVFIIHN